MAWIFLAVSEESQKHSEGTSSPSLTVKMTDTHKRYSYHEWLQEISRLLRYGTTLQRSDQLSSRPWTSSMEGFHARTFLLQEAERVWEESVVDYSLRSLGSVANYDPDSSSWRTSQRLLFEEQSELLENFAAYGMTVDGVFYPLKSWERHMSGNGGGYWPTPVASQAYKKIRKLSPVEKSGDHGIAIIGYVGNRWPHLIGKYLSHLLLESVMGYPKGWLQLSPLATAWFRPKHGKHLKD